MLHARTDTFKNIKHQFIRYNKYNIFLMKFCHPPTHPHGEIECVCGDITTNYRQIWPQKLMAASAQYQIRQLMGPPIALENPPSLTQPPPPPSSSAISQLL